MAAPHRRDWGDLPTKKEIGERIAQGREAAGMSMELLAGLVDIHRDTLERYEEGKHDQPAGKLLRIAHAIGQSFSYFAFQDGDATERLEATTNSLRSDMVLLAERVTALDRAILQILRQQKKERDAQAAPVSQEEAEAHTAEAEASLDQADQEDDGEEAEPDQSQDRGDG